MHRHRSGGRSGGWELRRGAPRAGGRADHRLHATVAGALRPAILLADLGAEVIKVERAWPGRNRGERLFLLSRLNATTQAPVHRPVLVGWPAWPAAVAILHHDRTGERQAQTEVEAAEPGPWHLPGEDAEQKRQADSALEPRIKRGDPLLGQIRASAARTKPSRPGKRGTRSTWPGLHGIAGVLTHDDLRFRGRCPPSRWRPRSRGDRANRRRLEGAKVLHNIYVGGPAAADRPHHLVYRASLDQWPSILLEACAGRWR